MSTEHKQAVALSSVLAGVVLTVTKLVVGLLTGSLAILSEAAHSGLDLVAALMTWGAVRVSDLPADDRHQYGHTKIESVSALIETGLLFLTSAWIIYEGVERLFFHPAKVEATWYSVAVIVLSIVIDVSRSRALYRVAKETRSQALEADALHFASDIWSSSAVLIGLGLVWFGFSAADAIAALIVACFVFHAGYELGRRTIDVLVDAAPRGMTEQVRWVAQNHPDVAKIDRIRVRPAGSVAFVELTVRVGRGLALEQVRAICDDLAERLRQEIPEADPVVLAEPIALDTESIIETVQIIARNRSLSLHDIDVHTVGDRRQVSFDIEVDEDMAIGAAHQIADDLERAVRRELGPDVAVDTHLDPRRMKVLPGSELDPEQSQALTERILDLTRQEMPGAGVHHVKVQGSTGGLYVSCHCTFPETMTVRRVHDHTVLLEALVWKRIKGVERVVIHAEPIHHSDEGGEDGAGGEVGNEASDAPATR